MDKKTLELRQLQAELSQMLVKLSIRINFTPSEVKDYHLAQLEGAKNIINDVNTYLGVDHV